MLTRPGAVAVATASLVGVVGWPVLLVLTGAWLTELEPQDVLWWVVGVVLCQAIVFQAQLTRRLWRFLDPRR